jgi:hypothetical protein
MLAFRGIRPWAWLIPGQLTFIIKQDLSRLNEDIRNLQALSKRLHPKPDQEGENNKNILLLLQGKLGDVSANFKVRYTRPLREDEC